jgi:hypothetical protein
MRNILRFCVIILFLAGACRNLSENKNNSDNNKGDTATSFIQKSPATGEKVVNSKPDNIQGKNTTDSKKEAKTIEVEIIKLNPMDSTHKMSFFHNDRKYFHNDSLYCELLYKLKEVESAAASISPEGDYVSLMIDDRPQGATRYYQIALYRIRARLDKMDRIDSYRIDIKSKMIEKHDVVKDRWIQIK